MADISINDLGEPTIRKFNITGGYIPVLQYHYSGTVTAADGFTCDNSALNDFIRSSPDLLNLFSVGFSGSNKLPSGSFETGLYVNDDSKIKASVSSSGTDLNISINTKKGFLHFNYVTAKPSTASHIQSSLNGLFGIVITDSKGINYWARQARMLNSSTTVPCIVPTYNTKGNASYTGIEVSVSTSGITYKTTDDITIALGDALVSGSSVYNANDPYENVGDEPDDPGQGDFDYSSDDVPIPDLPKTNVTDSGLVSLFAPDEGQLRQLAKFLWSDNFSLDSFKKIFNNPMDCILGLSILPIHLPHGGAKEITVGNIVSTVSCDVCSEQYVKLNCGSFTFSRSRFTGGYLDNAPYTRCYLYLPFIGTQEINIDEFMGSTLGVEYHIDILTGAMFCFVTRDSKLLLTYSGNCAENVPLSANDFTSTISSMLSMATVGAGAIATIATAGAAAPTTAGMASEALGARTASSLIGAGAQGANAVMNSKPNVSHSGSLGGGAGAMGQLYPYLIFIAPRPDIPASQNSYTGFPSNKIEKIGNLKGFNVIEAVNLKVEGANDNEMSEIEAILKGGVII